MSVVTPKFRVSYPNVFKARLNDLNGQQEYSVVALFPKDADLTALKAAAQEAIVKKWGEDKAKWPTNLKSPFRDVEDRRKEGVLPPGYEEGSVFMNLKTRQKPGVVDENVQPVLEESTFYAGCWARASLNAYAYDQKGNKGVAFGLGNIQKVGDGDPLGGRTAPQQDFAPIEGAKKDASTSTDLFS